MSSDLRFRVLRGFRVIKGGIEFEFEPAKEGGYIVSVPLYPSCVSDGDTFEEALLNIEDALRETLVAAKGLGLDIPPALASVIEGSPVPGKLKAKGGTQCCTCSPSSPRP